MVAIERSEDTTSADGVVPRGDEDTTFSALADDVHRELATHYRRDTDPPVSHVAHELGYAEQNVVTRSARRWFGRGPVQERLRLRGAD